MCSGLVEDRFLRPPVGHLATQSRQAMVAAALAERVCAPSNEKRSAQRPCGIAGLTMNGYRLSEPELQEAISKGWLWREAAIAAGEPVLPPIL